MWHSASKPTTSASEWVNKGFKNPFYVPGKRPSCRERETKSRNCATHAFRYAVSCMPFRRIAGGVSSIFGNEKSEITPRYAVSSGDARHQAYPRYFVP